MKALPPTTNIGLVVLLEFVDQRDEVAVAAHDAEGVDVVVSEGEFERIEREVDVGAILVAARGGIALHHLHRVFGELARRVLELAPVRVGDLGDDLAALLERFQHHRDVEFPLQRRFDADLNVVEVDENRYLEVLFHVYLLTAHAACFVRARRACSSNFLVRFYQVTPEGPRPRGRMGRSIPAKRRAEKLSPRPAVPVLARLHPE